MREFDYTMNNNIFTCAMNDELGEIEIVSFRGNGARLELPERIEHEGREWTLRGIGKKVFWGCRGLRCVVLPGSVCRIGDWAFSQCGQLEGIVVGNCGETSIVEVGDLEETEKLRNSIEKPVRIDFGNGVFTDCPNIKYIALGVEEKSDLAVLLAATVNLLPSEDLLKDGEPGSEHWFQKWDQRLLALLREDDQEGYLNMVLCGEEDIQRNVPEFQADKRRRKADLCMLRLLHSHLLQPETEETYKEYLLSHTKGCETEEAWEVIVANHGGELAYYELLAQVGGISQDNIEDMIEDLDAGHAETKAYLIRYKQEHFGVEDVFDQFQL
jgi:hypothetical protein